MDIVMTGKDPNIKLQLRKKKNAVSSAYVGLHTVVGKEDGKNKQYIACRKKSYYFIGPAIYKVE